MVVDGSGARPDGSRRHHIVLSGRNAWEAEREDLVAALHDRMRNPLASLQGYVELLLDGVAGPLAHEQQVLLERVRSATTKLATAVEEIVPRSVVREE
jgi:signal transduction histidine kinase